MCVFLPKRLWINNEKHICWKWWKRAAIDKVQSKAVSMLLAKKKMKPITVPNIYSFYGMLRLTYRIIRSYLHTLAERRNRQEKKTESSSHILRIKRNHTIKMKESTHNQIMISSLLYFITILPSFLHINCNECESAKVGEVKKKKKKKKTRNEWKKNRAKNLSKSNIHCCHISSIRFVHSALSFSCSLFLLAFVRFQRRIYKSA